MVGTPGTYNSPVDFQIPSTVPPNADKNLPAILDQIYNALQNIIRCFVIYCGIGPRNVGDWPALSGSSTTLLTGNLNRFYCPASETIQPGAAINLWNNAGTVMVRNASATTNAKPCDGFFTGPVAVTVGTFVESILVGGIIALGGLTPCTRYFLSAAVNGAITPTPPVAAGNIEQYLGIAIDATHFYFNIGYWIQH